MEYRIKHINNDFHVKEAYMEPEFCDKDKATYTLAELTKDNINTFDVIKHIALNIKVASDDVSYSGLKDEDGITTQLVAIQGIYDQSVFDHISNQPGSKLKLIVKGYSKCPLQIGKLHGNIFQITLRDIDRKYFEKLTQINNKIIKIPTVNYYDTQRFGIPDSLHNTHTIGKNILVEDWESALVEYLKSGNSQTEKDKLLKCSRTETTKTAFFKILDKRKLSFLLNAYMSYNWNEKVKELLLGQQGDCNLYEYDNDVMSLLFLNDSGNAQTSLNNYCTYSYYTVDDNRTFKEVKKQRQIMLYNNISVSNLDDDDLFEGKIKIQLSFYLQSGSYATMVVKQVMENQRHDLYL